MTSIPARRKHVPARTTHFQGPRKRQCRVLAFEPLHHGFDDIGVYLAAQAGFTTALQFEIARSDRDGYYMRRALLDEVKDNLASVDDWSGSLEKAMRNRISADYFLPTDTWVEYWSEKNGW